MDLVNHLDHRSVIVERPEPVKSAFTLTGLAADSTPLGEATPAGPPVNAVAAMLAGAVAGAALAVSADRRG